MWRHMLWQGDNGPLEHVWGHQGLGTVNQPWTIHDTLRMTNGCFFKLIIGFSPCTSLPCLLFSHYNASGKTSRYSKHRSVFKAPALLQDQAASHVSISVFEFQLATTLQCWLIQCSSPIIDYQLNIFSASTIRSFMHIFTHVLRVKLQKMMKFVHFFVKSHRHISSHRLQMVVLVLQIE